MRILHICYSDLDGGAARAAFRLHQAQRSLGLDSHMLVINKCSDDPFVHTVSGMRRLLIKLSAALSRYIVRLQKSPNWVHHSLNLLPSGLLRDVDKLAPDVVNLHWLGGEMLSVGEIGRISQPVVWTLHDMWAFSGAEHYDDDKPSQRYKMGYSRDSRNELHSGLDLDRWTFMRKQKAWAGKSFQIVTPSHWLADCVRQSTLFAGLPVTVTSNCIDHNVYRPLPRELAREALGLPQDKQLLLFGAMSSTSDPRKGYHLLIPALQQLQTEGKADQIELVVFGASHGDAEQVTGIKTHYMGRLYDDISLCLLYNSADLFVAPSLQDNLPNTLVESLACGTPCVAFNIGGMNDLINNDEVGYLIEKVDPIELSNKISLKENTRAFDKFTIANASRQIRMNSIIAKEYLRTYRHVAKT
ncbi:glycosyltransferase [Shewanella sp. HN-41]|uniref:glycosyltransferase n=1 Tax=Shewanella sp. HN-41 TaxID=327275 RepID=UPI0002125F42|nr:glycosyltransferase [Shewanella sp. HN-41]EGM69250.1 glycosyl transferase, group 1 [Shewanella sp. HN-41]